MKNGRLLQALLSAAEAERIIDQLAPLTIEEVRALDILEGADPCHLT